MLPFTPGNQYRTKKEPSILFTIEKDDCIIRNDVLWVYKPVKLGEHHYLDKGELPLRPKEYRIYSKMEHNSFTVFLLLSLSIFGVLGAIGGFLSIKREDLERDLKCMSRGDCRWMTFHSILFYIWIMVGPIWFWWHFYCMDQRARAVWNKIIYSRDLGERDKYLEVIKHDMVF